jgi:NarL family two-component system response regulator LiaR
MNSNLHNRLSQKTESSLATLTQREWEVLLLLAEGKSASEIADRLCVTTKSIYNNKNRINNKLGVKGPAALDHFASEHATDLFKWFQRLGNKPIRDRLQTILSLLRKDKN